MVTESTVEEAGLEWFRGLGYQTLFGPDIAPDGISPERTGWGEVVLRERLRDAVGRLNPDLPPEAIDEAIRKVLVPASPSLIVNNRAFHQMLVDGIAVEYQRKDGSITGGNVRLVDFADPDNNDWLAVNQFTVIEGPQQQESNRRPDIVVFLNGLPLVVIELKNAADENATIWSAFNQLQTYKKQIPSLFTYNEALIISDGLGARVGSLTANKERFMPWRTIEGEVVAPATFPQLQVLLHGVFHKRRFLDLLRHFIVFEDDTHGNIAKKMAAYHQFHAVNRAVEATIEATSPRGDRRAGVVWHTQGSGKSLTMAFYAGQIILHPAMQNPTIVVLTDRNDLDDQLFGTFARCAGLLRQKPVQAESREDLQKKLQVASGGVIFTTIQKFLPEEKRGRYPLLSGRRNIVVIADEAHRSQYDFIDGFAKHMRDALPNAPFIGFTGTPIELTDKNTRAVFGDYISVYDIKRSVEDGATVSIYYESRLAKLELKEDERPKLDPQFEEVTEGEEQTQKEKLKSKWAALESVVGSQKRINVIAKDLVDHFEQRQQAMDGKAMVVCMSRRICVELYDAIIRLRPEWHSDDDDKGAIKVVMTGSASDRLEWQPHIRNKPRREALAGRFRDETDPLKIVIVRDMWLTGFDVPSLHTMYVDKPMRGHGLMQAIARVNRVFKDKPGGLVVDYLGLGDQLRKALQNYTENGGEGEMAPDQNEAVAVMKEKYEICEDLFYGFDWSVWGRGAPGEQLGLLPAAVEHILAQEDGAQRLMDTVLALSRAFALAVPHEDAIRIRDGVAFFQSVRAALVKIEGRERGSSDQVEGAIKQIVSRAVTTDKVIDIFDTLGLQKPDISILSEEFLAEVKGLPQKNLAVEMLRRLLMDEIKSHSRKNLVQSRSFSEMLQNSINKYHNRTIETVAVIEELIKIAKELREAAGRGEQLGLTDDELAFYDALGVNDSAVQVLGNDTLKKIAQELVETMRKNTRIDWTVRESVKADLRASVKRLLRRYGYPPDKQEKATQTVIEQAELLCADWAA
ncbi:MAG: type I restriction endonuclease subunit R [Chloroflexi bacterium]|nr:type I restriction endonuclease subunit R [Chloroflexota bacterium]